MPSRIIRDGINTSARIGALTDGAELFYRRLMSVVDDYGRFYGHPGTLRAAAWPNDPDRHTDKEVRAWLQELTAGDEPLLLAYEVKGARYIQFDAFQQRIQSRSKFPAPPQSLAADGGGLPANHGESTVNHGEKSVLVESRKSRVVSRTSGAAGLPCGENSGNVENHSPTTNERTQTQNAPRKAPARAPSSRSSTENENEATDTETVRQSLRALAPLVRLPAPDDDLVRLVLSAARGAPGGEIHEVLRHLYLGRKFENIRSWGLLPIVVAQVFKDYVRQDTARSAAS